MHKSEPELTAKALLAAAEKYRIDIFAHPGEYVKCDIETLARGAKELGTMIEINSRHVTLSPDDIRLIAKIGAVMRPDSDAHSPERVGELGPAIAAAAAAGLILECLDRGLYPSWDAHDKVSLALAEQLGYQPAGPYQTFLRLDL